MAFKPCQLTLANRSLVLEVKQNVEFHHSSTVSFDPLVNILVAIQ